MCSWDSRGSDAQVLIRSVCYSGPVYRVACICSHTVYDGTCTCDASCDADCDRVLVQLPTVVKTCDK